MTKKDYKKIAEVLNKHFKGLSSRPALMEYFACLSEDITKMLKRDNESFNYDKFMEAVYKK